MLRILFFQTFFIMWILNVCIGFTHNNDTEKNKINKIFQELYQDCGTSKFFIHVCINVSIHCVKMCGDIMMMSLPPKTVFFD